MSRTRVLDGMARTTAPARLANWSLWARWARSGRGVQWALLALCCASAPAQAADLQQGAALYRQHCVLCHGAAGRPVLPGTPDLSRPTALLKPDLTLLASIRAGRGAMPAYQGVLRDRDILDIVAHLRSLR